MVAFSIFGFSVYWYGIFYALAFLLGYIALAWIGKKGFFAGYPKLQKLLTEQLEDLIFTIAVGVVLGGRLGHILIYGEGYYFQHWEAILKIWEGGMSFIGGIFGVLISIFVFFRLQGLSKRDYLMTFDLMLIFVPLGIFLGRFGNFLNQELYGIPVEQLPSWISSFLTGFGLTHMYPKVDQLLRVNTNLLSMLLEGMLLLVLQVSVFWRQIKKRQRKV
ncbi:MAG: prolipoprotein diacylglyceryl transferase [bacterium]|nr:prolipoprotein diacylglyceryl transferase [bacterium]